MIIITIMAIIFGEKYFKKRIVLIMMQNENVFNFLLL